MLSPPPLCPAPLGQLSDPSLLLFGLYPGLPAEPSEAASVLMKRDLELQRLLACDLANLQSVVYLVRARPQSQLKPTEAAL